MVRMVTRLRIVLSCLLVASLGGCSSGSPATSPPDAPTVTGGIVSSAGAGGGPGGVGGGGGTGGQLSTATSATPPLCVPGASVACACVTGQTGAQTCTSAGTFAPCVCAAPAVDAGALGGAGGTTATTASSSTGGATVLATSAGGAGGQTALPPDAGAPIGGTPASCVPGASVACACTTGQQGAQTCTSEGTFAACMCSAPTVDAGGAGGSDGAVTSPPDAGVGGAGTSGGTSTGGAGGSTASSSTGTTNSCSTVAGQGTITDAAGGTAHVQCNGHDYIVQSNQWGSTAGQTLTYGPGTKFKVTVQNGTGVNYNPASFPSIFLGANNNHITTGNELTRVVSSLNTVQTSWTWASNNASGSYNATYDVWFSKSGQAEPDRSSPSGAYLMVWFYKPSDNVPNGDSISSVTIAGKNWNLWVGTSNGVPCYSYVAQQNLNSLSFDLNLFIKDAVSKGYIQPTWGLTNVFAGFEIWSGGVGLETTDFAVTVN